MACKLIQVACIAVAMCIACACRRENAGPPLQVLGESTRLRAGDPITAASPWFDGTTLTVLAARGETIGLQVLHRAAGAAALTLTDAHVAVRSYAVGTLKARRGSTEMYGGSHGAGDYPDALTPDPSPSTDPSYFEIVVDREAPAGVRHGELVVGASHYPFVLTIAPVTLPTLAASVWAYEDPRELTWAATATTDPPRAVASTAERSCIDLFRGYGVLLSPDLHLEWWPDRKELLAGYPDIPVWIPDDPALAGEAVRGWIAATRGTGQVPFAIPIDEPRTPQGRAKVRALAEAVRAAGGGPSTFRFAVTDEPHADYGDLIDLYITVAAHREGEHVARWTYNGAPPRAGSMVLDALTPGTRTWGWIGWRWKITTWYVWDALYWHDRHNRKGAPLPGRPVDARRDATSFDDGEDHGNLDGVLALPTPGGCQPTLRLASLRRGLQDRALLDLAARCDPQATEKLAAELVPRALGDAPMAGAPAWPTDEAPWERARQQLIELASCGR